MAKSFSTTTAEENSYLPLSRTDSVATTSASNTASPVIRDDDSTDATPQVEALPAPVPAIGLCIGTNYSSLNDYIKHNYGSLTREQLSYGGAYSEVSEAQSNNISLVNMCKPFASSISEGSDDSENIDNNADNNISRFSLLLKQASSLSIMTHTANNNNNISNEWTLRQTALDLSLYLNLLITLAKLVAYIDTLSLSVLAALLDSVLDVVSQFVLNYTEKHSSMQRSSAFYPAGASRLEPIGVLTCAALMGMASFEVLKESGETLLYKHNTLEDRTLQEELLSFWSMIAIIVIKFFLYYLCQKAQNHRRSSMMTSKRAMQLADPTLEALAQDHWNDILSNGVAAVALICALYTPTLWFLDPIGAILISIYIIWSWYETGKEQIEQLTYVYHVCFVRNGCIACFAVSCSHPAAAAAAPPTTFV